MGVGTNAAIAKWQKETGIEPATGDRAAMLERVAKLAAEIITLTALESSGIRDGDGYWHGSDPLDGLINNLYEMWSETKPVNCPTSGNKMAADDWQIPF